MRTRNFSITACLTREPNATWLEKITTSINGIHIFYEKHHDHIKIYQKDVDSYSSYPLSFEERLRPAFTSGDLGILLKVLKQYEYASSPLVQALYHAINPMFVLHLQGARAAQTVLTSPKIASALPTEILDPIQSMAPAVILPVPGIEAGLIKPVSKLHTDTNKPQHTINNEYLLPAVRNWYKNPDTDMPPAVLIAANPNRSGGNRSGIGIEESFILDSNIAYGMPDRYAEDNLWKDYNGTYAVLCHTKEDNLPFWGIVMAAPNLGDPIIFRDETSKVIATTPSDRALFNCDPLRPVVPGNEEAFMRHIMGLTLIQFYMLKKLNCKQFFTGLFGCGAFNNNPEYYAAAVHYVSSLPMFNKIKICYAIGRNNMSLSDRMINDIFSKPSSRLLTMANNLFYAYFRHLCIQDEKIIKKGCTNDYPQMKLFGNTIADPDAKALNLVSEAVCQFYLQALPAQLAQRKAANNPSATRLVRNS